MPVVLEPVVLELVVLELVVLELVVLVPVVLELALPVASGQLLLTRLTRLEELLLGLGQSTMHSIIITNE